MKAVSFDEKALSFLRRYINHPSPSGYEAEGQTMWLDYIRPYIDDVFMDSSSNAVGIINPQEKYKVILEAHADEISWLVNYVDCKGFIHVLENGGADAIVAPGKRVKIHTAKGDVDGVFGWPAVHVRYDSENLRLDAKHLFVDCGCYSEEEARELGIQVGDTITFNSNFCTLNDTFFSGRGLDNRIGGFLIAEVARFIHEKKIKLPFGLYIVNAVQEEVGSRGAKMIADRIRPDIAIVTDASHDTSTPYIEKRMHGDTTCGSGPILAFAPAVHKGLLSLIIETAKESKIPFQRVAISRETDTDADVIALAEGGVISALIGPPLRYMHTPVELVSRKDIEYAIQLISEVLPRLTPEICQTFKRGKSYKTGEKS
jgi:putative aminopeptidase FrvX